MTIFDALQLIGGLCLFLFGMNIMGQALERRAGGKLQSLLGKLTTNKFAGLLTGSGLGILLLFKTNKKLKENLVILSIIYFVGVFIGLIVDLLI